MSGRPSNSLLAILGVLRRPAGRSDTLPSAPLRYPFGGSQIFVRYVRRARVVSGSAYYVYPVRPLACGPLAGESQGVVLTDVTGCGTGSFGTATAGEIEAGQMIAYGGGCSRSLDTSLVTGVVPDGVATVALHYPAGRVGGYSHKLAPAVTVTTTVVQNVLVVTIPRGGGNGRSWRTMTWRAANGHIIKTFNRS